MPQRVLLGPVFAVVLFACASSTTSIQVSPLDKWIPEIRSRFAEVDPWIPDSLSVRRVTDLRVLTWRRSQQAYCVTEALLWAELEDSGGATVYALVRAVRWPLGGGDFGNEPPWWALSSSPYAPILNRRFLTRPPTNDVISEIWPPYMFGEGEDPGFPVIQGEVLTAEWRRLVRADPVFGSYRLDPGANENC